MTQFCFYFPLRSDTGTGLFLLTQRYGVTQICFFTSFFNVIVIKKRNGLQVLLTKTLTGFLILEVSSHFRYWEFVKFLEKKRLFDPGNGFQCL
jgi:hypothetical protein